jgi:murein L,D-transpeptidase YafK
VIVAAGGLVLALGAGGWLVERFSRAPAQPCPPSGTVVAVHSSDRSLWLCRDGKGQGRFRVALGRGGLDKRSEGDRRTPTGRYALGVPRASASFHRFVPVLYPTAVQAADGRTGGAIGIHGPDARFRTLGRATTWVDWTAGCIAVGTRSEIDDIAVWLTRSGARTITID